ncbi:MAG TPA: type II secretion system minor pseudopilin GspJ [Casimicrobiaceae bacterium]
MRRAARNRGFTLVEALVAIAILGVVAVLAWRATDAMTGSEAAVSAESRRWQDLDAVLARMEADMRDALPRVGEAPGYVPARGAITTDSTVAAVAPGWAAALDANGDTVLSFARGSTGAPDEPGAGGQRVGYRLHGDQLEVLYWPQLDDAPGTEPAIYTLAQGIRGFRVLQLTRTGTWSPSWPLAGNDPIPRGVRIEITQADGSVIERILALR